LLWGRPSESCEKVVDFKLEGSLQVLDGILEFSTGVQVTAKCTVVTVSVVSDYVAAAGAASDGLQI